MKQQEPILETEVVEIDGVGSRRGRKLMRLRTNEAVDSIDAAGREILG